MAASVSSRDFCCVDTVTAFFSLVQAVIWLVLSILAVVLAGCSIIPDATSALYIIVFVYFYNEECDADAWLTGDGEPVTTQRTRGVAWYFLATSALRVAAAGALLVMLGLRTRRLAADRTAAAFWAWAALSAACLLGDLACAIVYAVDMGRAESLSDLVGVPAELPDTDVYWDIRIVPLVLLLFSFRWGILWIVEAALLAVCILKRVKKNNELVPELPRNRSPPRPTVTSTLPPRVLADGGANGVRAAGGGGGGSGGDRSGGRFRESLYENTATDPNSSYYLALPTDAPVKFVHLQLLPELPTNRSPHHPVITSTSPVLAEITRVLAENGVDSPTAGGGGGSDSRRHYRESQQANTAGVQQTSFYPAAPAETQQWGGARPTEPSWRDGGGDRLQGASSYEYAAHPQGSRDPNYPAGGGGGADREDRFQSVNIHAAYPPDSRIHNHYPGGGGGGGNDGGGGGRRGGYARPMRVAPPAPMHVARADYYGPQSPEHRRDEDPPSPLPVYGGQSPFFPAPRLSTFK